MRQVIGVMILVLWGVLPISQPVVQPSQDTHVLWLEPQDIVSRNLYFGGGGEIGSPNENDAFELQIEQNKRKILKDSSARLWEIRQGPEAKAELVAQRIMWAAGYNEDESYLTTKVRVHNKPLGELCLHHIPVGQSVTGEWSWDSNPFVGKPELSGLEIIIIMLADWDPLDSDNKIAKNRTSGQELYSVFRVEKSLGRTGSVFTRSAANPRHYRSEPFIDKVEGGYVFFHYQGKNAKFPAKFSVQDARWIARILVKLSKQQLTDALRAGGLRGSGLEIYLEVLQARIRDLAEIKG